MKNSKNPTLTIKEAAFNYHKGDFKAFKMWVATHKRDYGRFTEVDARLLKAEVMRCIMEENKTMLAALDFQMDGEITPYETFEMTSS
tara:strand:+ start:489 stop:749 length:261 start_codon:yes stop_codon:yes gene_type:complete